MIDLETYLKNHSQFVELTSSKSILLLNTYYHMNLKGTSSSMFLREGVWKKVLEVASTLPKGVGLCLFDGYRTLETQKDLFLYMKNQIQSQNPLLSDENLMERTRDFVADPFNQSIKHKLSHPTGGAIDLGLFDIDSKAVLDMGSAFDDPSAQSATFYFEEHQSSSTEIYRQRRDILYKAMITVGFTNYAKEWWHYDMGDFSWSKKMNCSWHYSVEESLELIGKS